MRGSPPARLPRMAFTPFHRGGSGEPLVALHGFTDTWRTWELVLPALEREHEVLAPALPGHAGGGPLPQPLTSDVAADAVERLMDEIGWETAHIVGNSLGGWVTLELAARGRARTAVALAPAGGWAEGDDSYLATLDHFTTMKALLQQVAPHADAIASTPDGRRQALALVCEQTEHVPAELVAHIIRGAAACDAIDPMIELARSGGWPLDLSQIACPLRMIWGHEDKILQWPNAAARYRAGLPQADWVELDGVGHCPQLDVPLETAQLILGFTR